MALAEDDRVWVFQIEGCVMSEEVLRDHHAAWKKKPILRLLYTQWYEEIVTNLQPGRTLELGGGSGNLKEFAPHVVCTDLVQLPWLDAVADAQFLPFAPASLSNIVLFDVLHHIENICLFFDEARRVLQPGGRLVVMDPYVSWMSWPIYRFFHPEHLDFVDDPLQFRPPSTGRRPFDANQAIATIVFERGFSTFQRRYPQFEKRVHQRLAFFAYPLSGGFDHPSLLPICLVRPLMSLEKLVWFLNRFLAFRILVVLEKRN
jgi:SAM-dependent methyltransferase